MNIYQRYQISESLLSCVCVGSSGRHSWAHQGGTHGHTREAHPGSLAGTPGHTRAGTTGRYTRAGTAGHTWQVHPGTTGRHSRAGTAGRTWQAHPSAPAGRSPPILSPSLQAWALPPALPALRTTSQQGHPSFMVGTDSAALLSVTVLMTHDYLVADNRDH